MSDFRAAWPVWLWYEASGRPDGALHTDPRDPGGTTRYGIAQAHHPEVDVHAINEGTAYEIVRRSYWEPYKLSALRPQRVATSMLLAIGNMRPSDAVRSLQRACRWAGCYGVPAPEEDGRLGPATLAAANACPPLALWRSLAVELVAEYADRAARRPASRAYLAGWLRRARLEGMPAEVEAEAARLDGNGGPVVVRIAAEDGEPGSEEQPA